MHVTYWKEEPQQRAWKLLPDNGTEIEKAIQAGAMFKTWTSFSSDPGNGKEVTRFGDFPLDFDSGDPKKALNDMRTLCLSHLPDLYNVDPYCIEFFCSGSKGFHAVIPCETFGAQTGDVSLPLIYKKIAVLFKETFDLQTLDLSLYNMRKGKMFRLPNVKRSNGRFKVPLSLEEVRDLSFQELWDLSKEPRQVDQVDTDTDCELSDLYEQMKKEVYSEIKDHGQAEPFKGEVKGVLPCVAHILEERPGNDRVNFNKLVMVLINYYQMINASKEDVWASVGDFLKHYEHSATYGTEQKRIAHWRSQWSYLKDNDDYYFSCAFMKSLLPGFDCSACEGKEETETSETDNALQIVTISDIRQMDIKQTQPLIEGLIRQGDSLLLTGPTGLGKSLTVNAIALAVASGRPLFNQFEVVKPHVVLILQSENNLEVTRTRWDRIFEGLNKTDYETYLTATDRIATIMVGGDCRISGDILNVKFAKHMEECIEVTGAGLMILDPLISFHRSDENANTDIRTVLDKLTAITRNTSVLLVHHHGKGQNEGFHKSRGASALPDWARGILTMTRQPHESKDLIRVQHTKAGNFARAKDFLLEVDGPRVIPVEVDVLCKPSQVVERLRSLGGMVEAKNTLVKDLIDAFEISRKTAQDAIDRTEDFGFICITKSGKSFRVSVVD
ncbi:MAG: AAA family ATPase [Deltaproteobacteria bacterium]|nr:AAA family ATPase [Deltaproteobacteria bacterium]